MNNINIKRFGLAVGITSSLLYLGCAVLLMVIGREETVFFFNTIFHGLDATTILKTSMPFQEVILGIVEIFVLGWFVGACIASIYNVTFKSEIEKS